MATYPYTGATAIICGRSPGFIFHARPDGMDHIGCNIVIPVFPWLSQFLLGVTLIIMDKDR